MYYTYGKCWVKFVKIINQTYQILKENLEENVDTFNSFKLVIVQPFINNWVTHD